MQVLAVPTTTSRAFVVAGGSDIRLVLQGFIAHFQFARAAKIGGGDSVDTTIFGGGLGHTITISDTVLAAPSIDYHAGFDRSDLASHAFVLSLPFVVLFRKPFMFGEFAPYGGPAFPSTSGRPVSVDAGLQFRFGWAIFDPRD